MLPVFLNVNPDMSRPVPNVRDISVILDEAGEVIPTASLTELENAAVNISRVRPPIVAVWGGDGTIGCVVSALVRAYGETPLPKLCLLPGGTMNCISRCIGARGTAGSMLARLIRAIDDGRDTPAVERTSLRIGERIGFLFGLGLIPNFLGVYDSGARQGPFRALQVFAMAAPGLFRGRHAPDPFFNPFGARITLNGETWEGIWTNVSAGGVDCLPLGFRAYTRASERPGAFHFVAHDLKAWGAAYELAAIKLGYGMQRVRQDVTSGVLVELDRKLQFNLDGDNFDEVDRFRLEAGPTITALLP